MLLQTVLHLSYRLIQKNRGQTMMKKLINGDYGLAKTFWLGGVLVNAILGPLMMTLSVLLPREINDKTLLMLTL